MFTFIRYWIFTFIFLLVLINNNFAQTQLQSNTPATYLNNVDLSIEHMLLLRDLSILSADSLEGRKTGTPGNRKAKKIIANRFRNLKLAAFHPGYAQAFSFQPRRHRQRLFSPNTGKQHGENLIGYIKGKQDSSLFLLISAHYDHDGIHNGEIYNGANDNASGVAFLLMAAAHFTKHPPHHSIIFAAFDAEESGLKGAHAFVEASPIPLKQIALAINLDMISPGKDSLLYVSGTDHFPSLSPFIAVGEHTALKIVEGHNSKDALDDWSFSSDHAPFFHADIPFLYFGVEDNAHYHKPSDTFENIIQPLFIASANAILNTILQLDTNLDEAISLH